MLANDARFNSGSADDARAEDVLRAASIRRVRRSVRLKRNAVVQMVNEAINEYARACEVESLELARKSVPAAASLQAGRRYRAFLKIGSCDLLLKRVKQTIDAAEAKIESNTSERIEGYYNAAAEDFGRRISNMGTIEIVWSEGEPPRDVAAVLPAAVEKDPCKNAFDAIDDVYAAGFGPNMAAAHEMVARYDEQRQLAEKIELVEKRALAEAERRLHANAQQVAGCCIGEIDVPAFGGVTCKRLVDVDSLRELLAEVRVSFASYERCVRQGGLLCAFGGEYTSQSIRGYLESTLSRSDYIKLLIDDREYGIDDEIPEFFDEDAQMGGDTIAQTIDRMRRFNAEPFRDVLVDDPIEHVERFWYGMKKLLAFVEDAILVDERMWDSYFDRAEYAACEAARPLAEQMDAGQAVEFRCALEKMAHSGETHVGMDS